MGRWTNCGKIRKKSRWGHGREKNVRLDEKKIWMKRKEMGRGGGKVTGTDGEERERDEEGREEKEEKVGYKEKYWERCSE